MATKQSTINYLLDQLSGVPDIRTLKMFGDYALYCQNKVVALVCDDELFVKITNAGKKFAGDKYEEGYAYKGAKASMHIPGDLLEDRAFICDLIEITAKALPIPKPKLLKKRLK